MITSTANAQVKTVVQLQKKAKEREAKQLFVIEGWKLFEEIKRDAPGHIEKTYVTEEFLQQSGHVRAHTCKVCNRTKHAVFRSGFSVKYQPTVATEPKNIRLEFLSSVFHAGLVEGGFVADLLCVVLVYEFDKLVNLVALNQRNGASAKACARHT